MNTLQDPALARVVARATSDPDVLAVLLFGSRARGEASAESDVDVCLVLSSDPASGLAGAEKRLEYVADVEFDVVVFQ